MGTGNSHIFGEGKNVVRFTACVSIMFLGVVFSHRTHLSSSFFEHIFHLRVVWLLTVFFCSRTVWMERGL